MQISQTIGLGRLGNLHSQKLAQSEICTVGWEICTVYMTFHATIKAHGEKQIILKVHDFTGNLLKLKRLSPNSQQLKY